MTRSASVIGGTPRVPAERIHVSVDEPLRASGDFVLYWMIANRRLGHNFALDRAVEIGRELRRPLLVLEPLRAGYRHACDRFHAFVLQGMAEHREELRRHRVAYYPYVEPSPGAGRGLVEELGRRACAVVTDLYPTFFLPSMVEAAARQLRVRFEVVDSAGLLPLAIAERAFLTARSFRRFFQQQLLGGLPAFPAASPFARLALPELGALPRTVTRRWPAARKELLSASAAALAALPIDHRIGPVADCAGGGRAARAALRRFVASKLARYAEDHNHPDAHGTSGLSPWLHFGHLSTHEVAAAVLAHEGWDRARLGAAATGSRAGFWGLSAAAEEFLEQLLTWRELGFNMAWHRKDHASYGSLPSWARHTLEQHAADPRRPQYDLDQLEHADTDDPIWNAAQRELRQTGRMHNYLRMLWGKRILGWSARPQEALELMLVLNDRYALDGRDPNSVSGICWVLGRYDRPWGPERPVFGTVRYMSSANTARKLRLRAYLATYGAGSR